MTDLTEAQKTWGASPTGWTSARDEAPGTLEFFNKARIHRDTIEQPWLAELIPFHAMKDRRVLEIGFGPGYDTLKFIQAGANYSGIDITSENIERTRKHMAFFGLAPDVRQGDAELLPYPDASFDVVYSNGVLHHVPHLPVALREAQRVLKPGGELRILVYHRHSVFYASMIALHILTGNFRRESVARRRSRIEATAALDAKPIVNVYSRREIAGILSGAGFCVNSISVRKCTPEDFFAPSFLMPVLRAVPSSVYAAIGRVFGWYLVIDASRAAREMSKGQARPREQILRMTESIDKLTRTLAGTGA
jgi:ubiquinone/menaquinone biosynthesis C-methylase UbiE